MQKEPEQVNHAPLIHNSSELDWMRELPAHKRERVDDLLIEKMVAQVKAMQVSERVFKPETLFRSIRVFLTQCWFKLFKVFTIETFSLLLIQLVHYLIGEG